ncbi:MAG: DUF6452 family protein [Paludibacter sp.]|nr:DUF6452 family protein [Paludibacter sp.]
MFHFKYYLKTILITLLFISLQMGFTSCNTDEECRKEKKVNLQLAFFTKTVNETTKVTTTTALNIDSIWVKALDRDSFIYKNKKNIKTIVLPLKKFENQSDFIIRFNSKTDTISIFHTNNENYFLSLECGCIVTHKINEVVSTNHYIKSIQITNTEINTTNATHLQIYN